MTLLRRIRPAALLVATAISASSCAVTGLNFREDTRFSWVSPKSGADVTLPFELEWEMDGHDGGLFAVFVDRSPMRPGRTVLDVVPDDHTCLAIGDCEEMWLADNDIFVTPDTSLVIADLRDGSGIRSDRDRKEIAVVLLDEDGKRANESVFVREVIVDRSEGS